MTREQEEKLIVEYMFPGVAHENRIWISYAMIEAYNIPQIATEVWLFHDSWDWLMPVIHRIGETDVDFEPLSNVSLYSDIDLAYKEVLRFIKWYNKNKDHGKGT